MAKLTPEAVTRLAIAVTLSAVTIALVTRESSAAVIERPSVPCPGAIDTVQTDNNTGVVIALLSVLVPSGATATCVSDPGVVVGITGTGSTLINNVPGLNVTSTGSGHTIVNNSNVPFFLINGDGSTITNNATGTAGTSGNGAIGLVIIGNNGVIGNAGTVDTSGADSFGIGIVGDMPQATNTGTARSSGADSAAIGLEGDNATITNSGTAESVGDDSEALFIEGNVGTITNSGTAKATGVAASAASIEGDTATITNDGDVTANDTFAFGLSAVGNDARLTNNKNITTSNGALAGMGVLGDDAILTNNSKIDTTGANGLGMGALGGVGAMNRGEMLTNAAGGTITTGGTGAHGIALGLENLQQIAGALPIPPGATQPAQGSAVNRGTITTSGADADGLHAFASAGALENRGTITTGGANANGMEARGTGAAKLSATNLGTITTTGTGSSALHGTGQNVSLINGAADGSAPGANLQVTTGTKVRGMSLNGVDSRIENYGNINVTGGSIPGANSFLDFSHGIVVQGGTGSQTTTIGGVARQGSNNTVINKGTINANTQAGRSILVDTSGVTIENQVGGVLNDGVLFNPGSSGVINNNGTINGGIFDEQQQFGSYTGGPQVLAEINNAAGATIAGSTNAISMFEADAFITNDGTISVGGAGASTAIVVGTGSATIVNRGTVTTSGTEELAIGAFSFDTNGQQQKSLAADIQNFGTVTAGSGISTFTSGKSSILNSGTITSTAADGFGVFATALDAGGDVDVFNQGSITTSGANAEGISAATTDGMTKVENTGAGRITTSGANAFGIVAVGGEATSNPSLPAFSVLNSGSVTTGGTGAHGVAVAGPQGIGTVTNFGTVTVASNTASAVIYDPAGFGGFGFTLVNEASGTLSSPVTAVRASNGNDNVTNRGTIIGDVRLGDGDDTFTLHDGSTITGTVFSDAGSSDRLVADFANNAGLNGDQFLSFDQFNKTGAGQLDFGGTLNVANTNVQQGGFMLQSGSNLISNVLVNAGATIGGAAATVTGNISGLGTIAPGLSPGQLDVIGDVDLSGKLAIEIAGLGTGQFDILNIAGSLNFQAAEIEFTFLNNFVPMVGDVFSFLNVTGAITGFNTAFLSFIGAPQGFNLNVGLNPSSGGGFGLGLTATAAASVPEPETLALFLIGLGGLAGMARRRRRTAAQAPT